MLQRGKRSLTVHPRSSKRCPPTNGLSPAIVANLVHPTLAASPTRFVVEPCFTPGAMGQVNIHTSLYTFKLSATLLPRPSWVFFFILCYLAVLEPGINGTGHLIYTYFAEVCFTCISILFWRKILKLPYPEAKKWVFFFSTRKLENFLCVPHLLRTDAEKVFFCGCPSCLSIFLSAGHFFL